MLAGASAGCCSGRPMEAEPMEVEEEEQSDSVYHLCRDRLLQLFHCHRLLPIARIEDAICEEVSLLAGLRRLLELPAARDREVGRRAVGNLVSGGWLRLGPSTRQASLAECRPGSSYESVLSLRRVAAEIQQQLLSLYGGQSLRYQKFAGLVRCHSGYERAKMYASDQSATVDELLACMPARTEVSPNVVRFGRS